MKRKKKRRPYRTRKFLALRREVRRLYALGLTQLAIARALGVDPGTVPGWLDRLRLPRRVYKGKHRAVEAEVRALAERGLKRSAIARRLGLSPNTLDKMLTRLGVRTGPARYVPREKWEEARP